MLHLEQALEEILASRQIVLLGGLYYDNWLQWWWWWWWYYYDDDVNASGGKGDGGGSGVGDDDCGAWWGYVDDHVGGIENINMRRDFDGSYETEDDTDTCKGWDDGENNDDDRDSDDYEDGDDLVLMMMMIWPEYNLQALAYFSSQIFCFID